MYSAVDEQEAPNVGMSEEVADPETARFERVAAGQSSSGRGRALIAGVLAVTLVTAAVVAFAPKPPAASDDVRAAIELAETCSAQGDNCKAAPGATKCCVTPGYTCFNKDSFWGGCKEKCTPSLAKDENGNLNPMAQGSWDCKVLGPTTPGKAPKRIDNDDFWKPTAELVDSSKTLSCSWPGNDCSNTKCCKMNGMKCFVQEAGVYAGCNKECPKEGMPGFQDAGGKTWDCTVLGDNAANQRPLAAAGVGEDVLGTSLYCIAVEMPGTYETHMVDMMRQQQLGVFACDAYDIMEGRKVQVSQWGSVANVPVFVDMWKTVVAKGTYATHDWTIKVDVDATFFPDVLKQHLGKLQAPASYPQGVFVKNCDYQFGFMGSLEVVSKVALERYVEHADECVQWMGDQGGEDYFMYTCMSAMGVGHMSDTSLLKDNYALPNHQKFNITSVAHCNDGWSVAFHPHKTFERWDKCRMTAIAARNAYAVEQK